MSEWTLGYHDYVPEEEGLREALCALGNGYFVTRGAAPDSVADAVHYPGTYVAGGYDRLVSRVSGRDIENEDLVNLPNWLRLEIRSKGGAWCGIDDVELLDFRQELDLYAGVLTRDLRFRDDQGHTTRWHERRLVSMADPHLAALAVEITPEDWSGDVELRTGLDGSVTNAGVSRYRALDGQHLQILDVQPVDAESIMLHSRMIQSRRELAQAVRTRVYRNGDRVTGERRTIHTARWIAQEIEATVEVDTPIVVEKTLALYTSRDPAISEACQAASQRVRAAGRFDELRGAHVQSWQRLWHEFDPLIEWRDGADPADEDTVLKVRLHAFHLLQTLSLHTTDYDVGAPARGWHGEAYRGHVFWDELFIFPVLNLRLPDLTRALLLYRFRRLPAARAAAQQAGYAGAMFPWQSGSEGREESQSVHLNPRSGRWIPDNSYRQRHINAAVAYNVWQYYQATADHEFMFFYGTEILIEIARFWVSIATRDEADGGWSIRGVMGPDEYHTAYPGADPVAEGGIDNNAYTNVMAAWCLLRAQEALDLQPADSRWALCDRVALTDTEIEHWDAVSRGLRIPFHGDGIISQFEGYEDLEEFDWDGYRAAYGDIHRLDRILESEGDTPNRYKVSKQADVLMLFYLFSADELRVLFERMGYRLEPDTIPKNVAYYMQRTSHGSTLSFVVHAWVLARSDRARSWHCFREALDSDIADVQGGTTSEGIHLGAMAGTLDLLNRCYLGIETRGNVLHLDPALPDSLERLRSVLRYRQHKLVVEATHDTVSVRSHPLVAPPITVAYRGRVYELSPGLDFTFSLVREPRA